MDKLNELVGLAEKADAVANLIDGVNPRAILAIAEAFRELEQRAEAAESDLELGMQLIKRLERQVLGYQAQTAQPVRLPKIKHPAQFDYADEVVEVLKSRGYEVEE